MARTAKTKTTSNANAMEEKKVTRRKTKTEIEPLVEEVKQDQEVIEAVKQLRLEEAKAKVAEQNIEIENLKAQVEQLKVVAEQATKLASQPVIVSSADAERVWFLWMADVADDNTLLIGEHGQYSRIVGKTGTFYVPKNDLSRILDAANRQYLEKRWLIVLSGLTDEEREALGVLYKDGEVLNEKAFRLIADMGNDLLEIFPALCDSHKEMVAGRLHEEYARGKHIDRNLIVELNREYPNVAFTDILEQMNAKELAANKKPT